MTDSRITITVRQNGSYFIANEDMARVRLVDHEGREISTEGRKAISLCRCGASANKPFCDAAHKAIEFQGAVNPACLVAIAPNGAPNGKG